MAEHGLAHPRTVLADPIAEIARAAGVTELPDDTAGKLKDVPAGKRTEVDQKIAALKVDAKDVSPDTPVKVVLDRLGEKLKPGFDVARLQPAVLDAARELR